jgi:hypothetical protein
MAIATSTAIALAATAASAGSSVYAAKKGSDAAKNAANTQARSAREAQVMAGNMFQQQQAMQSPYMNMGSGAAMTLGRLMGQPQGARFAAPPPNPWQQMQGGGGGTGGAAPMPMMAPQMPPMMGGSRPGPQGPPNVRPQGSPWGAFMPPQGGGY